LSVGEIAEMIGTSRRTVYGYERGMAKASVSAAYNLIWVLGIPVAKPIDVLDKSRNQRKCRLLLTAKNAIGKHGFLQRIFGRFASDRFTAVRRAPFDFVIYVRKGKKRIIGAVAGDSEPWLERRVDETLSVSRILKAHPILITDERRALNRDITCIRHDELSKIKKPEELLTSFT
jgi:putative transcriptional regulator